jgi:adenine deaminase
MFNVLRSATINPVMHYNLSCGLLKEGDPADFIIVDSLENMNVGQTWIDGIKVFDSGEVLFEYTPGAAINRFRCSPVSLKDIRIINQGGKFRVIKAFEGELLTGEIEQRSGKEEYILSDVSHDILKIVVKDRYNDATAVVGFITGFTLKSGAFASSVAHDSHNIIAIGAEDRDLVNCINEIIRLKGGLAVSDNGVVSSMQLDIAGIMSTHSAEEIATEYQGLSEKVNALGCEIKAPFMTLSFMALLVIPELKIGDKGLFDVKKFQPVSLFYENEQ